MRARPRAYPEAARRAWDLFGGPPPAGKAFDSWSNAHPARLGLIGLLFVACLAFTAFGFAFVAISAPPAPHPSSTAPAEP